MNMSYGADIKRAIKIFKQGGFTEAKIIFKSILEQYPSQKNALFYSGYTALLENRLKEAEEYLLRALKIMPNSKAVKNLLYDVYYRRNDYIKASNMLGFNKKKQLAGIIQYFKDHKAYDIGPSPDRTELEFLAKDPLPLVRVSINSEPHANFLIDTGGSEIIIDTQYAKSLGLKESGKEVSSFGGGKRSIMTHSFIESIRLGELSVRNLPVSLLDTVRFSYELYGNKYQVDGILGTSLFSNFLTTIDYLNNKLVLEIAGQTESLLEKRLLNDSYAQIPLWMAGDHYLLAKGRVNDCDDMMLFIDTGLGGNAFTCPKSTVRRCGFVLEKEKKAYGTGGGGKYKTVPFEIESLCLGDVMGYGLHGVYGPFPPLMENSFGFTINGLISHEFFRESKVIFDFSNMFLYIKQDHKYDKEVSR